MEREQEELNYKLDYRIRGVSNPRLKGIYALIKSISEKSKEHEKEMTVAIELHKELTRVLYETQGSIDSHRSLMNHYVDLYIEQVERFEKIKNKLQSIEEWELSMVKKGAKQIKQNPKNDECVEIFNILYDISPDRKVTKREKITSLELAKKLYGNKKKFRTVAMIDGIRWDITKALKGKKTRFKDFVQMVIDTNSENQK